MMENVLEITEKNNQIDTDTEAADIVLESADILPW